MRPQTAEKKIFEIQNTPKKKFMSSKISPQKIFEYTKTPHAKFLSTKNP
jgi:hypothetical protein